MISNNKAQILPISHGRNDGRWMAPESAAKYFRNGRGLAIGSLYNNLRAGRLSDIAIRDAYGWRVFVHQDWIDLYNSENRVIEMLPQKDTLKAA